MHLTSCHKFEALGTAWQIDFLQPITPDALQSIKGAVRQRLEVFEETYSRFRSSSTVTAMSQAAGDYQLPEDAPKMIDFYRRLYDATDGRVTPLIGNALSAAGYDATYSFASPGAPLLPPPAWDVALQFTSPIVTIKQPVLLDFGAAGKGYAADLVAEVLEKVGIRNYCIDASGDLVVASPEAMTFGLEHPQQLDQIIGTARFTSGSMCGSAGNRRTWGNYHHILDPVSLKSSESVIATWAYAASGLEADGLATAMFFTEPELLRRSFNFEYVLVRQDLSATISRGFPGELF